MGTSNTQKEIVGFHFQEIPLDEAVNAVIAGDGNYAVLKSKLLEALPLLPEGKAFAFGLPNGKEVDEDQRRGVCMTLNKTLRKVKLPWRVTYSGIKKLFVCVPASTPKTYKKELADGGGYTPRSKWNDPALEKEIMDWRNTGLSVSQIVAKGFDPQRVKYLCYQKYPSHSPGKPPPPKTGPSLAAIVEAAAAASGLSIETLTARYGKSGRSFRKAIQAIATGDFSMDRNEVGKAFGVTGDAVTFNLKTAFKVENEANMIRKMLLSDRIKQGVSAAKAGGIGIGRPRRIADVDVRKVKELHASGITQRKISEIIGIHRNRIGQILGGKY